MEHSNSNENSPHITPTIYYQTPFKRSNKNITTQWKLTSLLQGCAFTPLPSTFLCEIKKVHLVSWTNLTENLMKKHLPKYTVTSKSHIQTEHKNIQSTKKLGSAILQNISVDIIPSTEILNVATHSLFPTSYPHPTLPSLIPTRKKKSQCNHPRATN